MMSNWNIWPFSYTFTQPYWFLWLLLGPVFAYFLLKKNKQSSVIAEISSISSLPKQQATNWVNTVRRTIIGIKLFVFLLCVAALAGPFRWDSTDGRHENFKNGIDIVIAMDVSLSMYTRDFEPNRLDVSKKVAMEFVHGREADRIGLVVYAGEAYTACPPTLDHSVLLQQIAKITGEYVQGGTAIGVGLGTAVNRLRAPSENGKVIILLTDGSNNTGDISPEKAAELAKAKNIRVYTIGVGSKGEALSPVIGPFGLTYEMQPVEIDEKTLENIARETGGMYFRATDEEALKEIYTKIEKLEKAKFIDNVYQSEPPTDPSAFLLWAISLLLIVVFYSLIQFKYASE